MKRKYNNNYYIYNNNYVFMFPNQNRKKLYYRNAIL